MNNEIAVVHTTVDDEKKASDIAYRLVEERIAACVQIIPIRSIYTWKGKIEDQTEYLLVCKTKIEFLETLTKRIRSIHPYEVPEIIHYSVSTYTEYFNWLEEATNNTRFL